jgi:hypothetical protein
MSDDTRIFSTDFSKNAQITNFKKIPSNGNRSCSMWTDRHEDNSRYRQFYEGA